MLLWPEQEPHDERFVVLSTEPLGPRAESGWRLLVSGGRVGGGFGVAFLCYTRSWGRWRETESRQTGQLTAQVSARELSGSSTSDHMGP